MSGFSLHDGASQVAWDDYRHSRLGSSYTQELPRIGEGIDWRDQLWRVLDVVHPTHDTAGMIAETRVYVVALDNKEASTPLEETPKVVTSDADHRTGA